MKKFDVKPEDGTEREKHGRSQDDEGFDEFGIPKRRKKSKPGRKKRKKNKKMKLTVASDAAMSIQEMEGLEEMDGYLIVEKDDFEEMAGYLMVEKEDLEAEDQVTSGLDVVPNLSSNPMEVGQLVLEGEKEMSQDEKSSQLGKMGGDQLILEGEKGMSQAESSSQLGQIRGEQLILEAVKTTQMGLIGDEKGDVSEFYKYAMRRLGCGPCSPGIDEELQEESGTSLEKKLSNIESFSCVLGQIKEKISLGKLTLDSLRQSFVNLWRLFPEEFPLFDIELIACSISIPLFHKLFRDWDPLQNPAHGLQEVSQWKTWLGEDDSLESSDMSSPYTLLIREIVFPAVQSAATNIWNVEVPQPMFSFLETWKRVLPRVVLQEIINEVLIPNIVSAAESHECCCVEGHEYSWLRPTLISMFAFSFGR